MIEEIANPRPVLVGETYEGTVVKTTTFGAFVNLVPGRDGLVHISKLGRGKRLASVEEAVKEGDALTVLVEDVDPQGKISLKPVGPEWEAPEGPGRRSGGGGVAAAASGATGATWRRTATAEAAAVTAATARQAFRDDRAVVKATPPRRPRLPRTRPPASSAPVTLHADRRDRVQLGPARRDGADARRPLRLARLLGARRFPRRATRDQRLTATSSSTCCSRGPIVADALDIAEAFDAVGGDVNAFTAKEYTCYYARVLDRDLEMAVDHLADMLQHSAITGRRSRGRRPGDPRGDQHARGLARGRRPRRLHADAVARAPARPADPRHRGDDPSPRTEPRCGASTGATTCRGTSSSPPPATCATTTSSRLLKQRMDTGGASRPAARSGLEPPGARAGAEAVGRHLVKRRKTEQAHIFLGTNGLARNDPDRFAFLVVNTALGGGMSSRLFQEIREKRGLAYTAYSYHAQYTEAGLFRRLRGHDAEPRAGGRGAAAPRARARARRGLTEEEFERAKGHVQGLDRALPRGPRRADVAGSGSPRSPTARSSRSTRRCGASTAVTLDDAQRVAERVLSQPMTLTVLGPVRCLGVPGGHGVIRVGVVGATGRMGREVCRAVAADPELALVAAVSRTAPGARSPTRSGSTARPTRSCSPSSSRAPRRGRRGARRLHVACTRLRARGMGHRPRRSRRGRHHRVRARRRVARGARGGRSSRRTSRSARCCCCGSPSRPRAACRPRR